MPIVMGTAGHIDHGKTSLIKALTGIDCDRLAEEKKRGITIELGFAHLDLPGGRVGVVDVPGHERFVKNMVAGAAGVDFVLLVIAADEGVMPQTREHLDICNLLGIKSGLVALTKTDMVEDDWLEMVTQDVAEYLEGSFLSDAEILPVSSRTGQGLDDLRAAVDKLARQTESRSRGGLFRLPVDRVFTMKGFGTVITGTQIAGALKVGDELLAYPREVETKVRGLQSHGEQVEQAEAGRRVAVNLQGVEVRDLSRGDVLARPGTLFPSRVWELELTCLKSSPRPLKHRREAHFHHLAAEIPARLHFLDRDELLPGDTCRCQVWFDSPMAGVHGDRVVVRSFSPLRAVAGGMIIGPMGLRMKRFSDGLDPLEALVGDDFEAIVRTQLDRAGGGGLDVPRLQAMTGLGTREMDKLLQKIRGSKGIFLFDRDENRYASSGAAEVLSKSLLDHLFAHHEADPKSPGLTKGELASAWGRNIPAKLVHFLLKNLESDGKVVTERDAVRLASHEASLAVDESTLREAILAAYSEGGQRPPNLKDVLNPLDLTFKDAAWVFKLLVDEGRLVKVKEDMYFHAPAMDEIKGMVAEYFSSNAEMEPSDFRDLTGLSRKFAIPILEYLDKEKITMRVGDKRLPRKVR